MSSSPRPVVLGDKGVPNPFQLECWAQGQARLDANERMRRTKDALFPRSRHPYVAKASAATLAMMQQRKSLLYHNKGIEVPHRGLLTPRRRVLAGLAAAGVCAPAVVRASVIGGTEWDLVRDFGGDPTNTVSNQDARFNAAIAAIGAAGGGILRVPHGTYKLNGNINHNQFAVAIIGDNNGATHLIQNLANSNIFTVGNNNVELRNLFMSYAATPTTGGAAVQATAGSPFQNTVYDNLNIVGAWAGIESDTNENTAFYTRILISGIIQFGFYCNNAVNLIVDKFVFSGGQAAATAAQAIRVVGTGTGSGNPPPGTGTAAQAQGLVFSNGETFLTKVGLAMDGSGNQFWLAPSDNIFYKIFFNAAGQAPVQISRAYNTFFEVCDLQGGDITPFPPGLAVGQVSADNTKFMNCNFDGNGGEGAEVDSGSTHTKFIGSSFVNNCQQNAAPATQAGLHFMPNTTDFVVQGCSAYNSALLAFTGKQQFGINIESGCDRYVVEGNMVTGNLGSGVNNTPGTSASRVVQNNV